MNPIHDDVDALLRRSVDGPVPDAGFSDRVMQHVRPRPRASAWPLLACVFAGAVMCWLSLKGSPLWRASWQGLLAGEWSTSTIITLAAVAGLALLALGWSLAEADDH